MYVFICLFASEGGGVREREREKSVGCRNVDPLSVIHDEVMSTKLLV